MEGKNMKKIALALMAIAILVSVCRAEAGPAEKVGQPPNILFILADDLGYGDVACYNPESKVPTPNVDKLAADGMRFTDAHSPSTVCTPTRYSILTGRMQFRTGMPGVFTGAGGPCLIEKDRLTLTILIIQKQPSWNCTVSVKLKKASRVESILKKQKIVSNQCPKKPLL